MARAQFRDTVLLRTSTGVPTLPPAGASAAFYDVGTNNPISDQLFADESSATTLPNPLVLDNDGLINVWTLSERELDVVVSAPGFVTSRVTVTTDSATSGTGGQGPEGPQGPAGPTGPSGPAGPVGATGPAGPTGSLGPVGAQGPPGTAGATGPAGPQGTQGNIGPTGPQGPAGTGIIMRGTVPTLADLPTSGNAVGDGYIVAADNTLHVWDGSKWVNCGVIAGPTGPTGPQGIQGPTGPTGPTGPAGTQGIQGNPGPVGPIGATGASGPAGPLGPAGPTGPQGIAGPAGPQGNVGPAGPAGPQGPIGANGPPGVGVPAGGGSGQVLAKNSATDYDTHWVNQGGAGNVGASVYEAQTVSGSTVTLPQTPMTNGVLGVAVNGQTLVATRDWTIAGAVITFTTPLTADDVHVEFMTTTTLGTDANTVDGFHAYPASSPQPSALVATDASGLLPLSTIPSIPNANLGPDVARANQLTNGGFEIWQRGNAGFTTQNALTADRWQILLGGASTLSVSRDQTNVDGASSDSAASVNFTFAAGGTSYLYQGFRLSGEAKQLRGRTLSLSIRVRTSTASAVRAVLWSDGTVGTTGVSGPHSGGGTYETLRATYAVPADATYVNVGVQFVVTCLVYLDNASLVIGSQAADYVPLHPADDLARCLRYYHPILTATGSQNDRFLGMAYAGNSAQIPIAISPPMAVTPTLTISTAADFQLLNATAGGIICTGVSPTVGTAMNFLITATVASGLVAGNVAQFYATGAGAKAYVEANP